MMDAVGPGTRLAGRYVLHDHIASGGMASVWRAQDEVLARAVAVKILRADLAANPEFLERFRREAVAAARLNHPSIINVFDTGADQDVVFIVMEFFSGRTLAALLAARGPLDPRQAVGIMQPVLEALAYAHGNGVIHRDVKPGNILVSVDRVKVADFGIAKAAETGADLTTTGKVLGTVHYLAPEQVQGSPLDARSDVYSAGAVLYEMVTGRPPFEAETAVATALLRLTTTPRAPRDIRPGIPRELEATVMRALARDPEERFPSAQAMAAALEQRAASGASRTATRPMRVVRRSEPPRTSVFRSWMLVPLIVILVAGALVAAGLALRVLQLGGPLGIQGAPKGGHESGTSSGATIRIVGAKDYDPLGDNAENSSEGGLAIDGQRGTAWTTSHYNSAAFGGLKAGLGLWLDFGSPVDLGQVTVESPIPGWKFELLPGGEPDQNASPLASKDGSTTFVVGSNGRALVDLQPSRVRGVMIWIVQLAPDGGRFAAAVAEVTAQTAS